jgi:hypothetical protein
MRNTFEYIAVHLAMIDRSLQEQHIRFQSALNNTDPRLSLLKLKKIIDVEKVFSQNIATLETALAFWQADNANTGSTTTCLISLALMIIYAALPWFIHVAWVWGYSCRESDFRGLPAPGLLGLFL